MLPLASYNLSVKHLMCNLLHPVQYFIMYCTYTTVVLTLVVADILAPLLSSTVTISRCPL